MRSHYKYTDTTAVHFLTCTIIEWLPVFNRPEFCAIIIDSLTHCKRHKELRLYAYVIMDNHIHLVAEAPDLKRTVQAFKGFTAREIIRIAGDLNQKWLLNQFAHFKKGYKTNSAYQVWQEGSHPQLLQNEDMLRQKVEYIHNNPLRRGWVDAPEHWRYSSARNYLGDSNTVLEIDPWPV